MSLSGNCGQCSYAELVLQAHDGDAEGIEVFARIQRRRVYTATAAPKINDGSKIQL
jgi:hypothetical protein